MFSFINMYMENKKLFKKLLLIYKKLFEHTHTHIYTCIYTHMGMHAYVSKNLY